MVADAEYARLLEFRTALRQFMHWSEDEARAVGITPAHHQLLLAIRGHRGNDDPTIGDIAESLLLKHHSAVELVDRAEAAGLVDRVRDLDDQRMVRLRVTARGARKLDQLTHAHLEELRRLAPLLSSMTAAGG